MTPLPDLTGKTVTLMPAADTLSSDYRGKTGKVIGGIRLHNTSEHPPATGYLVKVLLDGHTRTITLHRGHLVVTPTPGTIEVDPSKLFAKLVDAADNAHTSYSHSDFRKGYRIGRKDALYDLFCELTGRNPEEVFEAISDAVIARREASQPDF